MTRTYTSPINWRQLFVVIRSFVKNLHQLRAASKAINLISFGFFFLFPSPTLFGQSCALNDIGFNSNTATNSITICSGTSTSINGGLPLGGPNFDWQVSTTGPGAGFATAIGTANSQNYSIPSTYINNSGTYYFRRVVSSSSGGCNGNSDVVTLVVSAISGGGSASTASVTTCTGSNPQANITLSGNTGTIQWQKSSDNFSTDINNIGGATSTTLTPATAGAISAVTYFRAMVTNSPCGQAYSNVITITPVQTPTTSNAGSNQTGASTCGVTSVTLGANTPVVGTGAWSIASGTGGSFGNTASPTSSFSGVAGNSYILNWTISNSPCTASSSSVNVTFNISSGGGTASTASVTTCTNSNPQANITLSGNTGTIQWQKSSDNFSADINNIGGATSATLTPATAGAISAVTYFRAMVTNSPCGLAYSNVITITPIQTPTTSNAGSNQTGASTCGVTSVTLGANTPVVGTGAWSIASGTGGSFGNTASPTSSFSGVAGNSYTLNWTISNSPCTASSSSVNVTFNISSGGGTASTASVTTCTNSNPQANITLSGNTGTIQWQKSSDNFSADINNIGGATSATLTPATAGAISAVTYFRAMVTNSPCGPAYSNVITITPYTVPTLSSTTSTPVCSNAGFSYTATSASGGVTFSWSRAVVAGISNTAGSGPGSGISETLVNTTTAPINITYVFTLNNNGCINTQNVVVAVNPIPVLTSPLTSTVCSNVSLAYTAASATAGVSFSWTRAMVAGISNSAGSGAGSFINESLNNTTSTPITNLIYQIQLNANGCSNTQNLTVTVNPTPTVSVNSSAQNICNSGTPTITFSSSVSGSTFAWTRDNPAGATGTGSLSAFSGSGNISSGTFTNSLTTPVNVSFNATPTANGCTGSTVNNITTITVLPVATMNAISNQTFCHNTASTAINFSGTGTSYTWTNSNTSIGLGASGTGNISSFTASNAGSSPISGNVIVTPVYTVAGTNCNGTSSGFSITINPIPVLTSSLTANTCSGSIFNYSPTSSATGVTVSYNWSRAVVAGISNAAAGGTGNVNETLVNTTGSNINVTYVYTLSGFNNISCVNPASYNVVVTVKPTPTVAMTANGALSVCQGVSNNFAGVSLSNPNSLAGTTLTWTSSNTAQITGLAASGTGNIPAATLTNTSGSIQYSTLTGTATFNGCSSSTTLTLQVNPPISNNVLIAPIEVDICSLSKQVTFNTSNAQGGDGTYSYLWEYSETGNNDWVVIPGQTGATLVHTYPQVQAFFRRTAYSDGCAANSSGNFQVNKPTTNGITQTTVNTTYCSGGNGATISLDASIPSATYTLQYEVSNNNWQPAAGFSTITGNGSGISFSNITTAGKYRIFANISGGCSQTYSEVTIVVNNLPNTPVASGTNTICAGASANIVGTLAGFSINWYTTASGGTALNASPVASGAAYAVTPSVTTKFYAEAVNNSTSCRSIGRDSVTITVRQLPVVNTATQSICSGSVPSLALSASNSPNGFTWQASANGNVGGLSTNTFTTSTINNNGVALTNNTSTSQTITYTVSANTTGPTCTGPSTTLVTVVVDPRPTVNNKTATICSANAFTVTPTNGVAGDIIPSSPITQYTWSAPSGAGFTGGTSASNASNISGTLTNTTNSATTATYTVTPIAGSCSGTAFTTTVTINPRPFVTTQNVAVCSGNTFTVTPANGGGNIVPASTTYAWPVPTGSNISGIAPGTGLSSISGTITNTSSPAVPVTATYTVTPTGPSGLGSCVGNDFTLVATINPLPTATISGTTAVCLNAASPNITFTGANGTAPYTFTYNINGGANQTANSVGNSITVSVPTGTAGVYNYNLVSVRDASATLCTQVQTGTATITVNPLPTATISGTTAVCLNAASPNITFTGANGTAPYTFTYNINGGANQTANSVGNSITVSVPTGTAGVYNYNLVSVRDASATLCTQVQSGTATITVNPLPTANISGTTVVCLNAASPNITFTGANGTAPYTFTYNINGGANQTANSVGNSITVSVPTGTPGVYNYNLLSVRDASATLCTQVQSGTATITVNPLPTATISGTTAVCLNAASPNITFTGANGTAPYTFTYNINGGANQTANSVGNSITVSVPTGTAGVYNYNLVSVRDASATLCTQVQSGTATVTVNPLPTANISGTTAVCLNAASPNITFTGANGTAPYTFTYNINGGANLTSTSAGNSITVSVPTGTAGVYNYNLLSVRDASATLCTQVQTGTATITVNPLPTATISGTTAVCLNAASPSITFTGANGTAPYTFTYNINGGANQTANSVGNSITVSVPTGTAGVYNYNLISVIDASSSACSQNQAGTATITVNTAITATLSGDATICAGGSATLTIAIPAGAGNYFGTINPGGIAFSGTAPAIPVIVSPGATSSYSIASISGTCVNASGTATVTIPNGTPGLWTCAAGNSDWFDCRNWANGMVPDNLTNVTISTPVGCNPVIDPNSPNAPADKIARSANMLIGGSANLSFAGAGNLYVAGNWNNTVGPSGFTAGTSTVTLMGSTGAGCTQTITTAGSNETFYNLVINNICNRDGAGLGDNVTLNSPVNVTGVLTLTDGIVKTSATNILTVTNPAVTAIAGGGAASYINGPIARLTNSTGTYIFPTGNPNGATLYGVYRPATIIPGSGSANSYTGAYLPTAAPEVNNQQLGTTGILTTEYWDIKPSGACTGTAVIGLPYVYPASASHWTAGMAPCSSCNVAIARPAPTAWYFTDFNNFVGTGFNGSIPEDRFYSNSGMIYTKPIDCNGFQTPHFTFGFNFATVLPVGLVSFEGKFLNNNDARLVWEVANSHEIRRFMLEHSSDGNRFSLVSDIPAGSVNTYQYDHKSLSPGLHYYRLQLTDKRGEKTYSKTLLLVNGKQVTVIRNIVPNPVTQSGYVNLLSAGRQQARIVIYDLAGRLIGERRYDLTEGENRLEVAAGKLAQGVYNLQVITGDGVSKNLRMIKE